MWQLCVNMVSADGLSPAHLQSCWMNSKEGWCQHRAGSGTLWQVYWVGSLPKKQEDFAWECVNPSGPCLNTKTVFLGMWIPMLKIRRSRDRLIFNMGIPILRCPPGSETEIFRANYLNTLATWCPGPLCRLTISSMALTVMSGPCLLLCEGLKDQHHFNVEKSWKMPLWCCFFK